MVNLETISRERRGAKIISNIFTFNHSFLLEKYIMSQFFLDFLLQDFCLDRGEKVQVAELRHSLQQRKMSNVLEFHSPSATSVTAFTSRYTLKAWNFPPSVDLTFMCAVRLSRRSHDILGHISDRWYGTDLRRSSIKSHDCEILL